MGDTEGGKLQWIRGKGARETKDDRGTEVEAMGRRVILMEIFIESQQSAQWAS